MAKKTKKVPEGKKADIQDQTDKSINKTDALWEFLSDLNGKVSIDDNNRETWKNKMVVAYNQRQGIKKGN